VDPEEAKVHVLTASFKQAQALLPISLSAATVGVGCAYVLTRNPLTSIGAGLAAPAAFLAYFCLTDLISSFGSDRIKHHGELLACSGSLILSGTIVSLCQASIELVILISIISTVATREVINLTANG
jgi:hypothetical protein